MSALACDRKGCTNVMCDRYSDEYGYICYTCFEELVGSNMINIVLFMGTPKPAVPPIPLVWYDGIFPLMEG